MRILTVGLLVGIIISLGFSGQVARGESESAGRLTVVLVDRDAVGQSSGGGDMALSAIGLISTLGDEQALALVGTRGPDDVLGPFPSVATDFRGLGGQVEAWLSAPNSPGGSDLLGALAGAYNLLGNNQAAPGSTVYLIAGGPADGDTARELDRLSTTVGLFGSSGWPVVGLALPGASESAETLLNTISSASGGSTIALSIPGGLSDLANRILGDRAQGRLSAMSDGVLAPRDVFTSTVDVAPGTREATLLFFKESRQGSLRLSSPSGLEADAGDRASPPVETPHAVIWRLTDPEPGLWQVDVSGVDGLVSAWHHQVNRFSLSLLSYGAVPVGQRTTIVAFAEDENRRVVLDDVEVTATIETPDGALLEHKLNDAGLSGDSVAGDGYFSAIIPPVGAEGDYGVDLELRWPDGGHQLSSRGSFTAQAFPTVDITALQTQNLLVAGTTTVATAAIHVRGEPFAVPANALTSSLAVDAADTGVVELVAQQALDDGRAWLYDVYFTPGDEALHTLNVRLAIEYAGRQYSHTSDDVVLSSLVPALPAQPVAVAPTPSPEPAPEGFPWGLLAIPAVVVAGIVAGAAYWGTRTPPYGYLYDDRNALATDFASLERRPLMKLLFRDRILGSELGLPGLEAVSFKFFKRRVGLASRRISPTVRVNNQPLVGETTVRDRAWIGTQGALYSFAASPLVQEPAAAQADD